MIQKIVFIASFIFLNSLWAQAQSNSIHGRWYTENDASIILLEEINGAIAGTIVWLKRTHDETGNPKTDKQNPKKELKDRPILGLTILKGLKKDGKKWAGGEIYDPNSGNTYKCEAHLDGDVLKVRGYIGVSLIGRTTLWRRAGE